MKKFTLLLAGICFSLLSVNAQLAKDVGVTSLPDLYNGIMVYPNVPLFIVYERENFGTTAITSTDVDSFTMEISVDGIKRQTFYRAMTSPFAVGATEVRNGVNPLDWGTLGINPGNNATCVRTVLWKSGSNIDMNTSNDETCVVVNYSSSNFTYDAAPDNLVFSTPMLPPGSFLPIPSFPSKMTFDLTNPGATDLIAGLVIPFDFSIDGVAGTPLNVQIGQSISSGGGSAPVEFDFAGSLPSTAGPFDICLEVNSNDDSNGANDEFCVTYNMGTNSIDETEKSFGEIYYNVGLLRLKFNDVAKGIADVAVFETSGRQVGSYKLDTDKDANHEIDVNQLNTGIYIVNVTVNGQAISYRFAVE